MQRDTGANKRHPTPPPQKKSDSFVQRILMDYCDGRAVMTRRLMPLRYLDGIMREPAIKRLNIKRAEQFSQPIVTASRAPDVFNP